ncbi:MAG: hypothetical protein HW378_1402 [Anaerolineales bacterium]|jgi:hypothetical protein|nr:hypothetical protein [Anaerolineales bacterium]MBM2847841.1 hypothetical protein [Anaerolineales bacterium]
MKVPARAPFDWIVWRRWVIANAIACVGVCLN